MAKIIADQISPSQVSGRLATWHRIMENAGLTYDDLQKPINNPELRIKLVRYWQSGGFEPSVSQQRAREIMGCNFFGVEEGIQYIGINPTRRQQAVLSEIPFDEEILKQLKDTHILVAFFPLSRLISHFCKSKPNVRYKTRVADSGVSWQLISKNPADNTKAKNLKEQVALLGEENEVPTAKIMKYACVIHEIVTGKYLFNEGIAVRTSSIDAFGHCVCIDYAGFDAYDNDRQTRRYYSDLPYNCLALASARKCN